MISKQLGGAHDALIGSTEVRSSANPVTVVTTKSRGFLFLDKDCGGRPVGAGPSKGNDRTNDENNDDGKTSANFLRLSNPDVIAYAFKSSSMNEPHISYTNQNTAKHLP